MTRKPLELESTQFAQSNAGNGVAASKKTGAQSTPDSSYQSYLFGSSGSDEHPAWSDSTKGRAAIRILSRGIVGAAFFTIGGRMASTQLKGYNQHEWEWDRAKPLQAIAKLVDVTLGRGIEGAVRGMASLRGHSADEAALIAKKAVTFRESRQSLKFSHTLPSGKVEQMQGRSYGADVVGFTFDFAMASVGDALTRNIVQAIDPNVKKSWRVNDEGKAAAKGENWHFLPGEFLKWSGKTALRIITKNQGEDWAAAIPYAFQMKYQRQALNKAFGKRWEGHDLQFDHGWNGGAYRVDRTTGKITGDMQLVGAIDLHARFTGYNWYTLMYREAHDAIGNTWNHWKDNGFKIDMKIPDHFNPITATLDGVGHTARYVTKSFIKANMFMNPAVIPFWVMRVPQSKWRGDRFIESGALGAQTHVGEAGGLRPFHDGVYDHYKTDTRFDRFEKGFSQTLNPLGKFSNWLGGKAANVSDKVVGNSGWPKNKWLNSVVGQGRDRHDFMHSYVDASLSYTPYMWAKAETALRVDDNKGDGKLGLMDVAIYKFMDDVASFKFKAVPDDIKKMWNLGTNFERPLKAREGAEPDAQEIVQAPIYSKPSTLVHASSIEQTLGEPLRRAPSVNDGADHADKRWAQMVAGSDINAAQFHPANTTRH